MAQSALAKQTFAHWIYLYSAIDLRNRLVLELILPRDFHRTFQILLVITHELHVRGRHRSPRPLVQSRRVVAYFSEQFFLFFAVRFPRADVVVRSAVLQSFEQRFVIESDSSNFFLSDVSVQRARSLGAHVDL